MISDAANHAASIYTINAIAAIVRREGHHDYVRNATSSPEAETASLCGVTVLWDRHVITLVARDLEVKMDRQLVEFIRGTPETLQSWHKVLSDLDNVFLRRQG